MKRSPRWHMSLVCLVWVVLGWLAALGPRLALADEVPETKPARVTLHDQMVFVLRTGSGPLSAEARAREATLALGRAVKATTPVPVFVDMSGALAVVRAGSTPIVQLGAEDAELAGDASVEVHASRIASAVRDALRREQERT